MNVENLRLPWADGDVLHGVPSNNDPADRVVFDNDDGSVVITVHMPNDLIYDVTCTNCWGNTPTRDQAERELSVWCTTCNGTGVVEQVPDRPMRQSN